MARGVALTAHQKAIVRKNRLHAYGFLLPNLIGLIVFTFVPVIISFGLSFMKWNSATPAQFVGLRNFRTMFSDSGFFASLWNTFYYTLGCVPLTIIIAVLLAVLLNTDIKGLSAFRAIHFFPHICSVVALSVVWQFLYYADAGPINMALRALGFTDPPRWTASLVWAMPALIIMNVWRSVGYYMVMFLAGLQTIPKQLYEAANMDGANEWKKFWAITLPMLSPTMFFAVIICIINSFHVFTAVYIMTQGGPGTATSVLVYQIYNQAFVNFNFGYASALSLVLFIIIFAVTLVQFRAQEKWVNVVS